jgi:hypothetical protein
MSKAKKGGFSQFLDTISNASRIKITETTLPIARMSANVSAMVTGDDISLRTSLLSPVNYDKELCKLLLKHSEVIVDNQPVKLQYNDFVDNISNIDKLLLLWALYKSTYDNLTDERELTCRKEECNEKFKVSITMDDLIHEDSITIWDKTDEENNFIPFNAYRHVISIELNDIVYDFNSRLPSVGDNNRMLGMVSTDALQSNLDSIGSIFSKSQHMTLLVDAIRVTSKKSEFDTVESSNINEILLAFQNYLPYQISEKFFKNYSEHFDKYVPNFYYNAKCPYCGEEFKYNIDLELEFFRTSLHAGRKSL